MTSGKPLAGTFRKTSNPFKPGVCTSRNTKSGAKSRMAVTAAFPVPHCPTTCMSSCSAKRACKPLRASGSSSTITMRTPLLHQLHTQPSFHVDRENQLQPGNRLLAGGAQLDDDPCHTKREIVPLYWRARTPGAAPQVHFDAGAYQGCRSKQ